MHYKKTKLICTFIALMPLYAVADHDLSCVEALDEGHKIIVKEPLPKNWLTIGSNSIYAQSLHKKLFGKFKKYYNKEGIALCVLVNNVYITISNGGGFGPWAEYSTVGPKCRKCESMDSMDAMLVSKTGIEIGQSKTEVSSILKTSIKEDVVSIEFQEYEKNQKGKIYHEQSLRLEFNTDKLIRYNISEHRERA